MSDNITILVKLFETLKESSDKNEDATQQLIVQQLELVGHIKHLPIEDLKQALKEHAKDSADSIDLCAENITVTSKDILEEIKKLSSKVSKMILVVLVTFSVLTGTYVFISNVAEHKQESKVEQKIEMTQEDIVDKVMEKIRKEKKMTNDK